MKRIFAVALTGLVIAALTIRVSHSQTPGGSVAGHNSRRMESWFDQRVTGGGCLCRPGWG